MEGWHYMMVLRPLLLSKLPALRGYQVVPGPRYLCRNHPPHTPPCVVFLCTLRGRREVAGGPQWVFPC